MRHGLFCFKNTKKKRALFNVIYPSDGVVAGPSQPVQPPGGTPFQHEVRAAAAAPPTQTLDHRPQQVQYQQHINHLQQPLQLQREAEKDEEEDFIMGKNGRTDNHSRFDGELQNSSKNPKINQQ